MLEPWQVSGASLLSIWNDLEVAETTDGTRRWLADLPGSQPRRLTGVGASDDTVVAAFDGSEDVPGD
jgi:hypothetical protein